MWRELRLRALADAPDAFGDTLAAAQQRPESDWIRGTAPAPDRNLLLAEEDGTAVGIAFVRIAPDEAARANLYAMWVTPAARRRGTGRALIEAAGAWAESKGVHEIILHVTETNHAAFALYVTAGFIDTGQREALRPGSSVQSRIMSMRLPSAAHGRAPMYSIEWFETFAATVPAAFSEADLQGITAALPLDRYPRILDVACGIGRISGPLASRGYAVTGLDISVQALSIAKRRAAGPCYVALDQQHIGRMKWVFDGALFLWNSLGFVGRSADLETLAGVARTLRPGGTAVFDLYHPDWLDRNPRSGQPDDRGAVSVHRWTRDGRCFHKIHYASGRVDDIQFNVYRPEEIRDLATRAGLEPGIEMVGWSSETRPSAGHPRYQLICTRAK